MATSERMRAWASAAGRLSARSGGRVGASAWGAWMHARRGMLASLRARWRWARPDGQEAPTTRGACARRSKLPRAAVSSTGTHNRQTATQKYLGNNKQSQKYLSSKSTPTSHIIIATASKVRPPKVTSFTTPKTHTPRRERDLLATLMSEEGF